MKRVLPRAGLLCAVVALFFAGLPAAAQESAVTALVHRMVAAQGDVHSYTARVNAHIAMHSFPYLSPTLEGTYYHKEPSKNKIVFTSGVPFVAEQFSKVYPQIASPAQWFSTYIVSLEGTDGAFTMLKLVPRKHGRVSHIDAKIDQRTADLVQLRWNYDDGGYATLNQTYSVVHGHRLVTAQSGHLEVPHYSADLTSTFTAFDINAHIPDSVFSSDN